MRILGRAPLVKPLYLFMIISSIIGVSLASAFYLRLWVLELLVSQALVASLGLALSAAAVHFINRFGNHEHGKHHRTIGLSYLILLTLTSAITAYNIYAPTPVTVANDHQSDTEFVVGSYNRYVKNSDLNPSIEYLKANPVDILVLQEVNKDVIEGLATPLEYSSIALGNAGSSGSDLTTGILSAYPIVDTSVVQLTDNMSALRSVIFVQGSESGFAVYSVHIWPPSSNSLYKEGNQAIHKLADKILADELPVIVAGDFNTTVYSPVMRDFRNKVKAKLELVSESRMQTCSWYGLASINIPLCMRIDHIFLPPELTPHDLYISTDLGSDHRLISSEVGF